MLSIASSDMMVVLCREPRGRVQAMETGSALGTRCGDLPAQGVIPHPEPRQPGAGGITLDCGLAMGGRYGGDWMLRLGRGRYEPVPGTSPAVRGCSCTG